MLLQPNSSHWLKMTWPHHPEFVYVNSNTLLVLSSPQTWNQVIYLYMIQYYSDFGPIQGTQFSISHRFSSSFSLSAFLSNCPGSLGSHSWACFDLHRMSHQAPLLPSAFFTNRVGMKQACSTWLLHRGMAFSTRELLSFWCYIFFVFLDGKYTRVLKVSRLHERVEWILKYIFTKFTCCILTSHITHY